MLKRDIREGLVAACLFTAAEMRVSRDPGRSDLTMCPDEDLLAEVKRRMAAGRTPRTLGHELVDSVAFLEQVGPDSDDITTGDDRPPVTRARARAQRRTG